MSDERETERRSKGNMVNSPKEKEAFTEYETKVVITKVNTKPLLGKSFGPLRSASHQIM